jgi:ubiquinone/menaquinone biosynthesis C-methylase UbiE
MANTHSPITNDSMEFSFKWFAEESFFKAVNGYLVDLAKVSPGQRIVELACGTGTATRLIRDRLQGAKDSLVIGVDSSAVALREAIHQLGAARDVALEFIQGRVEVLSTMVKDKVDGIIFCNGIHYVSDKESLLEQIEHTLKDTGTFAFNTSFFDGAHVIGTESFYRKWMFKAIRSLRAQYGLRPRAHEKVESRRQLTAIQYAQLLESGGFTVKHQTIKATQVPLDGWVNISRFEDFVAGALPGVPLRPASESLQEGARQTFQELGIDAVPRNWLSIVAEKTK